MLLDVTRLIWRRWTKRRATGVDRVCLAYLRHFGPRARAVIQHDRMRRVLGRQASQELFGLLLADGDRFKRRLVGRAIANLGRINDRPDGELYLNIGHTGLNSAGFRQWVTGENVRPIYFVHDLIPITHPQYCRAGEAERHRERMRTVLTTGAGVIANSQATLDELERFARKEDLPVPSSLAAWLGIEPAAHSMSSQADLQPCFVTVGTIEARKNHILLLRIWSRLVDRLGSSAPKLLIIGQRGWEAEHVFDILDGDRKLDSHVIELNNCSDKELAAHLASARALLFPSFVEGYGLPLIEALAAGVPTIASDLPAFRELCGSAPTYVDPDDEAAWESAILDYAQPDSSERTAQLRRIQGFAAPSWDEHFSAVEAWLASLP